MSSAELVYGCPVALLAQFLETAEQPPAVFADRIRNSSPLPTRPLSYAAVAATPPAALLSAKFVYVRRGGATPPLAPLYVGPYLVIDRQPKFFKVQVGTRTEVISIDRLKPHLGTAPVSPAVPPLRGRPPADGPPSSSSSCLTAGSLH